MSAHSVADASAALTDDSSLAPYFRQYITAQDFDEVNIEIIRNTLYRKYYEHFYEYCKTLEEPTSGIMKRIIEVCAPG